MAQQEQNVDEKELLARTDVFSELTRLGTSELHTRLKVRYAAGIGISIAVVMRMASLPLDMAQSISTFAFITAIPLFAYLIFSIDEAESPNIEWIWTTTTGTEMLSEQLLALINNKIDEKDFREWTKSKLMESKERAHKRVIDDLKVGLVAYFAVIIGFTALLWHIAWYYSVLFVVLSFLMSTRFFRTFKRV